MVFFVLALHRGFDGRILSPTSGAASGAAPWHLEFTYQNHHASGKDPARIAEAELCHAPTQDNLLVLFARVETKLRQGKRGWKSMAIVPWNQ
ncbi:hypothetical protein MVEG_10352 [Podila verticillata NRRL 6337]|nr:hypothetical protein MVEG_10352 [Podila verticillata NRRL 6337]